MLADRVCRRSRDGIIVTVRLTPKSSCDQISGARIYNGIGVLKTKVRAIPDKGKANTALEKLIANWLRVPGSSVRLVQGSKSRQKSVEVHGDPSDLMSLVEARLAGSNQI